MRAVIIKHPGGPEVLSLEQVAEPIPQKGEVLVRVKATSVNRADLVQRRGHYPAPPDSPADIPGLEFAGIVESVGEAVSDFKVGDRVCGLAGGGTYAEYVLANQHCLARVPANLSFIEAASVPEVFTTAYDAMVSQCNFKTAETLLVHAVGSGVGLAGLQIAKLLGGKVIGTARSENKLESARAFGLDHGLLVKENKFSAQVKDITGGAGPDVVLELVGGTYLQEDINCASTQARIILIGLVAGSRSDIDLAQILRKRLTIKGSTLRMRPLEEKIIAAKLLQKQILPLFERGLLRPVIEKTFPLSEAAEAHRYVEENRNFGKIVLEIAD